MFYNNIKEKYGSEVVYNLKQYSKNKEKLAQFKNRKIFLLKTKSKHIFPKFMNFNFNHIQFEDQKNELEFQNVMYTFKKKVMNLLIQDTVTRENQIMKQINVNLNYITQYLPESTCETFVVLEEHKFETKFCKIRETNINKFNILMKSKNKPILYDYCENSVENVSSIQVPDYVKKTLSLGQQFSIPFKLKNNNDVVSNKQLPVNQIICNIENRIKISNEEEKNVIRNNICGAINKFKSSKVSNIKLYKNKVANDEASVVIDNISRNVTKTKQFLNEHKKELMVIRADKSNKTVVIDSVEYYNKMEGILNDKKTYKKIKNDITTKIQETNNKLVKTWMEKELITDQERKQLTIHNSQPPKMYGLIKLHKPGYPFRVIVSSIQSPLYNLSKLLANILSNVVGKTDYTVKDSWKFHEFIKKSIVPKNYCLISLDVVSLYTSIPVKLAIAAIESQWMEIKKYTKISKKEFLDGVKLCLNNTYFQFEGHFYEQCFGLAMGSPISACVANLTMEYIENKILPKVQNSIHFYKRFVDDLILCIPIDKIEYIHKHFNKFNESIQFTLEKEKSNTINFLDITITHNNGRIYTKWYKKPTASGRYLNFLSSQPMSHKKAAINNLTNRALKFTHPLKRPEVIQEITNTLRNNNYPEDMIRKTVKQNIHKIYNTSTKKKEVQPPNEYISIPYIQGLSENISHLMKHKYITSHKSYNNLKFLYSKLRSPTEKMKQSNVVYNIPCNDCNVCYVGQTTQYLKKRIEGHKYHKKEVTALSHHTKEKQHKFNFDKVKILAREENQNKRHILEMIHIKQNKNTINNRTDISNLSSIYSNIL